MPSSVTSPFFLTLGPAVVYFPPLTCWTIILEADVGEPGENELSFCDTRHDLAAVLRRMSLLLQPSPFTQTFDFSASGWLYFETSITESDSVMSSDEHKVVPVFENFAHGFVWSLKIELTKFIEIVSRLHAVQRANSLAGKSSNEHVLHETNQNRFDYVNGPQYESRNIFCSFMMHSQHILYFLYSAHRLAYF